MMGPQSYMLKANEELYEKSLTPLVEDLLRYSPSLPPPLSSLSLSLSLSYLIASVWCRHGGGIGDTSIRKMSYFEGSIDPMYKVSCTVHV